MVAGFDMDPALQPDPAVGSARLLLALRHALADPLSSAALKLDLVERRLLSPAGAEVSWLVERVRATQVEIGTANRLLDLLLRLAEIDEEQPEETSLVEVCRTAGVPLATGAALPPLRLRHRAAADAIRSAAAFGADPAAATSSPEAARAAAADGRVTLELDGPPATELRPTERLLNLPHGDEAAEALFVARAAAEADGGSLLLQERGGQLVAVLSWPVHGRAE